MKRLDRLRRLERKVPVPYQPPEPPVELTDEYWLKQVPIWAGIGMFDREADFPAAWAAYEAAVALPQDDPAARRAAIDMAFDWVAEIGGRTLQGLPPLTEGEFAELAGWWAANQDRLRSLAGDAAVLEVGGATMTMAELRAGVERGARAGGATAVAEQLRWLRGMLEGMPASLAGRDR